MGPTQSLVQGPLLVLCWVGLIVLPIALARSRRHTVKETWLGVVILWGGIGAIQVALSLSDREQFLGVGALVLGLAILVGLNRFLWRPRRSGTQELRRAGVLAIPGLLLSLSAMAGTEEILGWSELKALRRSVESGLAEAPLLVPPSVALWVTFFGLWSLAVWLLPERYRVEPPAQVASAGIAPPPEET